MTQVQEQTINEVIAIAQHETSILAVLLCGSLAEDRGNPASDVDVIVVVDDARRYHSFEEAEAEFASLLQTYKANAYEVVLIPQGTTAERASFLERQLGY